METKNHSVFSQIKQQEMHIGRDEMQCSCSEGRLKTTPLHCKISPSNFSEHVDLKKDHTFGIRGQNSLYIYNLTSEEKKIDRQVINLLK